MRVVLVPGFSQPSSIWNPVRAELTQRAPQLVTEAIDLPDGLDFVATAHALAHDRVEPALWVGYSLGGRLALQVALDRPAVVAGLVFVSASPGIADDHVRAARLRLDDADATSIERDGVDAFLDRWLAQPLFATLPRAAARRDERARTMSRDRLAHQMRHLGQGAMAPLWDRLGELTMPVTVVTGELDEKYTDLGVEVSAAIPPARHVTVDAGHSIPLEAPAALAQVIADSHDDLA